MKKTIKIILWTLAGILLLATAVAGTGYLWSYRLPVPTVAPEAFYIDSQIKLGETAAAQLELALPLHIRPGRATTQMPPDLVSVGAPEIKFHAYRWSRAVWTVSVRCRPLKPGIAKGGKVAVELPETTLTSEIPPLTVVPGQFAAKTIELAGELPEPSILPETKRGWLLWGLGSLMALGLAGWLIWRIFRPKELPPTAWERAARELVALRRDIQSHKLPVPEAFARLTDVVRGYLAERYALPFSSRTTAEFFDDIRRSDSPLPEDERPFLGDFLAAADLIKFAKAQADEAQLLRAVDGADHFVTRTTPRAAGENTDV